MRSGLATLTLVDATMCQHCSRLMGALDYRCSCICSDEKYIETIVKNYTKRKRRAFIFTLSAIIFILIPFTALGVGQKFIIELADLLFTIEVGQVIKENDVEYYHSVRDILFSRGFELGLIAELIVVNFPES